MWYCCGEPPRGAGGARSSGCGAHCHVVYGGAATFGVHSGSIRWTFPLQVRPAAMGQSNARAQLRVPDSRAQHADRRRAVRVPGSPELHRRASARHRDRHAWYGSSRMRCDCDCDCDCDCGWHLWLRPCLWLARVAVAVAAVAVAVAVTVTGTCGCDGGCGWHLWLWL